MTRWLADFFPSGLFHFVKLEWKPDTQVFLTPCAQIVNAARGCFVLLMERLQLMREPGAAGHFSLLCLNLSLYIWNEQYSHDHHSQ